MFLGRKRSGSSFFIFRENNKERMNRMRKKKNLWSGVSILIVAVLVITAFIRGNAQAWILAAAFALGGMGDLLFPCSVYQGGASQAGGKAHPQKMRKAGCGLRLIRYPRSVRPRGAGTASPCQLPYFSLSAIGIPQRNLGVA